MIRMESFLRNKMAKEHLTGPVITPISIIVLSYINSYGSFRRNDQE